MAWIGKLFLGPLREHRENVEWRESLKVRRHESEAIIKLAKEVSKEAKKRKP